MEVIRFHYDEIPSMNEGIALALGDFDGLHRGHERLLIEAALSDYVPCVLFFSRPYQNKGPFLTSLEDKIHLASSLRIERAYVLEVDDGFFLWKKEKFIALLRQMNVRLAVVGEDFRFGYQAEGRPEDLQKELPTKVVPLLKEGSEKISSGRILQAIESGNIEEANALLGHPYELSGLIKEGKHLGRTIGFPTVNVDLSFPYVLPKAGVYAGIVYLSGRPFQAMINVGTNPTVDSLALPRVEAHLFGYQGEAYGKLAYVSFLAYLREEKKFDSIEELKEQLSFDRIAAQRALSPK